jgi:hypothetical protein
MSHVGSYKEIAITKDLILGQKGGHAGEGIRDLDPHHLETIL